VKIPGKKMIAGTGEILEEHTNPLLGLRHGVPPPPGHPYLAIYRIGLTGSPWTRDFNRAD